MPTPDHTQIRRATAADLAFIQALQRRYTDELGFLPAEALERYAIAGQVLLRLENDQPAGYLLYRPTMSADPRTAHIVQAAVPLDAQRLGIGASLVRQLRRERLMAGSAGLRLTVAADIPAADFWRSVGFTEHARRAGGASRGRTILEMIMPLANGWSPPADLRRRGPGGLFASRERTTKPAQPSLFDGL